MCVVLCNADSQSEVLVGLESKQPKVVAGTISCLNEIIQYVCDYKRS